MVKRLKKSGVQSGVTTAVSNKKGKKTKKYSFFKN